MWKKRWWCFGWQTWWMVLVDSSLYFVHLELTWECVACACDAHVSWGLLVNRFSLTCGLLHFFAVHEINQAWYTCGILFKKKYTWDTWVEPRYICSCNCLIYPWYLRRIVLYMCYSNALIVHFPFSKTLWFLTFSEKNDEPIKKLQILYLYFLCTSYAL
jgi:hypothetical protein